MARPATNGKLAGVTTQLRSGTPLFVCDANLRIVDWNKAAERLTGITSEEAVGEFCWRILSGRADDGSLVCSQGCSNARLARKGWPVSTNILTIRSQNGPQRIALDTISSLDEPFRLLHVMREAQPEAVARPAPSVRLTARQLQVLHLLDEGRSAREIARELSLSESTVRNHIRAVLAELGAHSQLQAVHNARRAGLL